MQEAGGGDRPERSRRLVHRKGLDQRGRFDGLPVVPTRFVRACPRGHVDDVDWAGFVHEPEDRCRRQLWLDEVGTTGDLADLFVRCECGRRRPLYEAAELDQNPLGPCRGARPWLGINTNEGCNYPSRLLIRTASNAYFPQIALSLPDRGSAVEGVVRDLWDDLQIVDDAADLAFIKKKPKVAEALASYQEDEILETIGAIKRGHGGERPVKQVELEALLRAPEGFGDDVPIDPDFHARRLPDAAWRRSALSAGIAVEHPAKTRRHHRRGSACAPIRRSILDDGLARRSPSPRPLRPSISRTRRPCGSTPRQGSGRGRRGGIHDLGEPHRCRLRPQHRARGPDSRSGAGLQRDEPLSGIDRRRSVEAVASGLRVSGTESACGSL